MEVSYQHANPSRGNESYLLRFRDPVRGRSACVLVDAGDGVDVDALLGDDEHLTAVLLTHLHLDHYRSLAAAHRDAAPVYAAPDTARIVETVLSEGARQYATGDPAAVVDAVEPVEGWVDVTDDLAVHPVPAGHAPAAAGFVLRFLDGDDAHYILATGDFTRRRAAGYPGFETALGVDVGAVFLTGATSEGYRETLTGAVGETVERARAGSTVLVAASGLAGVQVAYLLAHVDDAFDAGVRTTVVGQPAKLWTALGYDHPTVRPVPEFDDVGPVLDRGTVVVAGPEVPTEGSSGRLFDHLSTDPDATLVQLRGGATDPVETAGCTVSDYVLANHPTQETVDATVEALSPVQVVVTHQSSRAVERYKDKYDSFVWATTDRREHVLYDGSDWRPPPWVTEATERRVRNSQGWWSGEVVLGDGDGRPGLPTPARDGTVDLAAEGLDRDVLADRLHVDPDLESAGAAAADRAPTPGEPDGPGSQDADGPEADADDPGPSADAGGPADDGPEPNAPGLAEVHARLAAIESALATETTPARVVDAGDGDVFLRLLDPSAVDALDHGETVEVAVDADGDDR